MEAFAAETKEEIIFEPIISGEHGGGVSVPAGKPVTAHPLGDGRYRVEACLGSTMPDYSAVVESKQIAITGEVRRVFDVFFDYKTDRPARSRPDADRDSPRLRSDHELLWTKKLNSGVHFAPTAPSARRNGYLIYTDTSEARHWYGSDAITSSYTGWSRPTSLAGAIASLNEDERSRYLNPPYTIGSAMIWPVRKKDRPTINTARGFGPSGRLIGDRMDLTLECIRRHYSGEQDSPLAGVLGAYADFFELFDGFTEFVDYFHLQDLVTPDYNAVRFYLPFDNFERSGAPVTRDEYVTYREATLEFIAARARRMAEWVRRHHPDIDVL
ncbi:DUF6994 family protein [Sinomonas sp. P10A9]|uniref:Uncharacterized protein n=1 Tax=Sinomonas puerhi TaxID=3238584 RepID=A0AB39L8G2_9MICC